MRVTLCARGRWSPAALVAAGLLHGLVACKPGDNAQVRVRGQLVWNDAQQTLQPCGRSDVYWLRVLASNQHFDLHLRVKELSRNDANAPLIADIEGHLEGLASGGPRYRVDKTFVASWVRSVKLGTCPR